MPNGPFAYAEGYRARVPADVAGPALLELAGDRGLEGLPASEVVASARPEQSPLHDVFEWDDATAAEEYRLEQARGLVRSVCVVVTGDDGVETRHHLFVNLRDGEGYRRVIEVRRDAPSYERLVDLALADLKSAREWLSEVKGLDAVTRQIASIERVIHRRLSKITR